MRVRAAPQPKTDFYLVTGFLGSGKTTFLLNLLASFRGDGRIGVIVNEFGSVGVDARLLASALSGARSGDLGSAGGGGNGGRGGGRDDCGDESYSGGGDRGGESYSGDSGRGGDLGGRCGESFSGGDLGGRGGESCSSGSDRGSESYSGGDFGVAAGLAIYEIDGGSIFCSCRLDKFEAALEDAQELALDALIVEASGFSEPSAIRTMLAGPRFAKYRYRGAVCIVDAPRYFKLRETARACVKQLSVSDMILVNKSDLAEPGHVERVELDIRDRYPSAEVYVTSHGRFDRNWLVGMNPGAGRRRCALRHGTQQPGPQQPGPQQHGPQQHGPQQHNPQQHGPQQQPDTQRFDPQRDQYQCDPQQSSPQCDPQQLDLQKRDITLQSRTIAVGAGMDAKSLRSFVSMFAEDSYRVKGIVCLKDGSWLVDCVGADVRVTPFGGTAANGGTLVALAGKGMPLRRSIRSALSFYPDCADVTNHAGLAPAPDY